MPYIRELRGIWHLEVFVNVTDSLSGSCCINSQWPWGPLHVDPPPRNLCERCWAPIPPPVVLQPPPEGRQLDKEEMTRLEQHEPHQRTTPVSEGSKRPESAWSWWQWRNNLSPSQRSPWQQWCEAEGEHRRVKLPSGHCDGREPMADKPVIIQELKAKAVLTWHPQPREDQPAAVPRSVSCLFSKQRPAFSKSRHKPSLLAAAAALGVIAAAPSTAASVPSTPAFPRRASHPGAEDVGCRSMLSRPRSRTGSVWTGEAAESPLSPPHQELWR